MRQLVTGFHSERDDNGRRYCLIEVDAKLVPTLSRPWRPFQGWRYLSPEDAPADHSGGAAPLSDHMLAELRSLGADLNRGLVNFIGPTLDRAGRRDYVSGLLRFLGIPGSCD